MIVAAAAAICLQAKPNFVLKPVWAAGPTIMADEVKVGFTLYGYWTSPTTFRWLAKEDNPGITKDQLSCICEFDSKAKEFHVVSRAMEYEDVPPDWSDYKPRGRYVVATDNSTQVTTYVDMFDLKPRFQTTRQKNGTESVIDQEKAGQSIFCQGNFQVDGLGAFYLMYDSPDGRFIYQNQGVISCASRSWEKEEVLVPEGKLPSLPGAKSNPVFVGDPDGDPFAIQNDRNNPTCCYYFDSDWDSIKVDPATACYDAGKQGFLVRAHVPGSTKPVLQRLDPKSGAVLWSRSDIADTVLAPRWFGNYVMVATQGKGANTASTLHILDLETGNTLSSVEAPPNVETDFQARGNTMIFHDAKGRFFAYQLVQG